MIYNEYGIVVPLTEQSIGQLGTFKCDLASDDFNHGPRLKICMSRGHGSTAPILNVNNTGIYDYNFLINHKATQPHKDNAEYLPVIVGFIVEHQIELSKYYYELNMQDQNFFPIMRQEFDTYKRRFVNHKGKVDSSGIERSANEYVAQLKKSMR